MTRIRSYALLPFAALGILMSGCSLFDQEEVIGVVSSVAPTSAIAGEWILASTPALRLQVTAEGEQVTGLTVTSGSYSSGSGDTLLSGMTDFEASYEAETGSTLLSFLAPASISGTATELPISLRVTPSEDSSTLSVEAAAPETWPTGTTWTSAYGLHALWDTDADLVPDAATTAFRLDELVADETHHQTISLGFSGSVMLQSRELYAFSFTLDTPHQVHMSLYTMMYGTLMLYDAEGQAVDYGVSYYVEMGHPLEAGTYHLIVAPAYGAFDGEIYSDSYHLSLSGTPLSSG